MSKSLGNVVAPQDVVQQSGADILRLWVVASDYSEDLRIGPEILKHQADAYRRLRNTLRYLLGALDGFDAKRARRRRATMPELERWVLHRLAELDALVRARGRGLRLPHACSPRSTISAPSISRPSISTCARTRSIATRPTRLRRRAARTRARPRLRLPRALARAGAVLHRRRSLALPPRRRRRQRASICELYPEVPARWRDDALGEKWERDPRAAPRRHRRARARARAEAHRLEPAGRGRGLSPTPAYVAALAGLDLAEICITSAGDARTRARRRRAPSPCPMCPASACVSRLAAGREMPALLAGPARGRHRRRRIPISAAAAPTRSDAGLRAASGTTEHAARPRRGGRRRARSISSPRSWVLALLRRRAPGQRRRAA